MSARVSGWIPGLLLGLATVGLVSVVGGCGESSKKSSKTKSKGAKDLSIPKDVQVKLLSAGTGEKKPLRYRFRAPETHQVGMSITVSVGVSTEERSVPVKRMPTMEMLLTLTHRSVSQAGVLKYDFELTRAGLAGGEGGSMKKAFSAKLGKSLQGLVGIKGTGEATPRGRAVQGAIKLPASLPGEARKAAQNLQEQLQRLAVALPEQPLGVGAKWEVRQPLQRATVRMGQTSTFTLVKRKGDRVTLDVTLAQFAPQQELKKSHLPKGATVVLHSMRSSGTGRFEIDLTRPAPAGFLRYRTRMDQTVSARGKSRRMQLDMGFDARFKPQPSPAK